MSAKSSSSPEATAVLDGVAWPNKRARVRAERSLRWGRRVDFLIPRFALDSKFTRFASKAVTVVSYVWGFLLSTGRVQKHGDLIVFTGLPKWAFRRGGICIGHCYLTNIPNPSAAVIRHEQVHVRQWQRYGFLFPFLNLLSGLKPLTNRFEIEAGLSDGGYLPASGS